MKPLAPKPSSASKAPFLAILSLLLCCALPSACTNLPFLKYEVGASGVYAKFSFDTYYAMRVEVYSITEGSWAVDADSAATDTAALEKLFTGWSSTSVNTLLSQAGIWIKSIEIKFIDGDNVASHSDIVVGTSGDSFTFNLADGGGTHTSPARRERIVIGKEGDRFSSSWATVAHPNVFLQYYHGRNIMAHELGHNFALRHVNTSDGCETGNTGGRVMNSSIYPDDYNFAGCEIKIARETMSAWLENYPDAVRVEKPPGRDLAKAIGFFEEEDFASTNYGFSNTPDTIANAPAIRTGAAGRPGGQGEGSSPSASPAREPHYCSLHGNRSGTEHGAGNE